MSRLGRTFARPVVFVPAFVLAYWAGSPAGAQQVFAPSQQPDAVRVFNLADNGNVPPLRSISGANAGFGLTFSTLVDLPRRELFVADFTGNAVRVFGLEDDGDVAPRRVIAGVATELDSPIGLALDPVTLELFVKPFGSDTGAWTLTLP